MILGEVHLMSVCQINDLLKKFRDNRFTAGVDRVVPITTDDSTYRKKKLFFFTTSTRQLDRRDHCDPSLIISFENTATVLNFKNQKTLKIFVNLDKIFSIQLNNYETAPNSIQLTQNWTSDCLLIQLNLPVFTSSCMM